MAVRLCADCGAASRESRCATCKTARARARQELRGPAWPQVRAAVLERYGHVCGMCGARCPHPRHHHVDHKVPLVKVVRRRFEASNLWPLCERCDKRFGGRV